MGYLKTEGGGRGSSESHESPLGPLCRGNINIDVHVLVRFFLNKWQCFKIMYIQIVGTCFKITKYFESSFLTPCDSPSILNQQRHYKTGKMRSDSTKEDSCCVQLSWFPAKGTCVPGDDSDQPHPCSLVRISDGSSLQRLFRRKTKTLVRLYGCPD